MPRSETDAGPPTATIHQGGLPPWVGGDGPEAGGPGSGTPARMAQEWYINAGGPVEGPVSADALRDRAAAGTLRPTDGVSTDRVKWVAASTVAGLTFPPGAPRPPRPLLETVVTGSVRPDDAAPPAADCGGPCAVPVVSVPGYRLLDTIGAGACGVVYKALHEKLKRVVALKTVLMPDRASAALLDRFKQEAVSLARLHHPNIVAVFDSGMCATPAGQAFFAMELLDGEDLDQRLERAGPLDERAAWLVARQTAAALAHAAKLGVVHRDVKPANLFLVQPPTGFSLPPGVPMVKVTDFGLALTRGPEDADARQTAAGMLVGTPVYMAPEQFAGSDVDPRADIYSLGVTVYHALTGRPPFDARTLWEVMKQKSGPAPAPLAGASAETAALVAAMMAPEAKDRPADYADLLARIDALPCLEGGFSISGLPAVSGRMAAAPAPTPTPEPVALPPVAARPRGRWVYAAAALVLIGAGAGVAALAGAFSRPAGPTKGPDGPEQGAKPVSYVAGSSDALYDGRSVVGWMGQGLMVEDDGENKPVLAFEGTATHALKPKPHFRVILAIDRHDAAAVEVVVATAGPAPGDARWLVRLDRDAGVAFGRQAGRGAFEPAAPPVPFPPPKPGRPPYLELKYERAGGTLTAWLDNQQLGQVSSDGLKTTELRVQALGGAVRIESAEQAELVEQR